MNILLLLIGAVVVLIYFGPLPLLIAALIWFFFVARKLYREIKSLSAFQGNEAAKAMTKGRLMGEYLPALGKVLFLAVMLGLPLLSATVFGEEVVPVALFVAAVVGVAVFLLSLRWSYILKKRYRDNFKETVVKPELARAFGNLRFEPDKAFDPKFIRDLNFFRDFNGYSGNDLIDAEYRGLHFTQFDMKVAERGTVREAVRGVFRGRVMRFDFADSFRGRVQVLSKGFDGAAVTGSRGEWQRVETELAEFNKYYEVHALDPLDAMAVLTPQMIEGIFFLKKAMDVPSAFYFSGNTMTVFMSLHRDAFDVSGKRTLLEEHALLDHDIAVITGFLDVMYFKRQTDAEGARSAGEVDRAEVAASVASSVELSGSVETTLLVERGADMAQRGRGLLVRYRSHLIIAVYLVSTLYAFVTSQGGFTWEFPLIMGGIIGFTIFSRQFATSLGALVLYLLFIL